MANHQHVLNNFDDVLGLLDELGATEVLDSPVLQQYAIVLAERFDVVIGDGEVLFLAAKVEYGSDVFFD